MERKISNEHVFELEEIYIENQIVDKLMPAFLGHSFTDINQWLQGKKGIREGKEHTALWRIMLDASVVKENNLCFDTSLWLGEDTKFINTYFLFAHSVGVLKETLYYLTIREGSANVTSNENPILMAKNKEKLIDARKEIDKIAAKKGKNTYEYWQGTIILSSVQLAIRLSHVKGGRKAFHHYITNKDVKAAIKAFQLDKISVKAIPIFLLKMNLEWLLYMIFKLIPINAINRLL